jgi:hypothetical protein
VWLTSVQTDNVSLRASFLLRQPSNVPCPTKRKAPECVHSMDKFQAASELRVAVETKAVRMQVGDSGLAGLSCQRPAPTSLSPSLPTVHLLSRARYIHSLQVIAATKHCCHVATRTSRIVSFAAALVANPSRSTSHLARIDATTPRSPTVRVLLLLGGDFAFDHPHHAQSPLEDVFLPICCADWRAHTAQLVCVSDVSRFASPA